MDGRDIRSDPLLIEQGVDWATAWPVIDDEGNAVPLDNGWAAKMQARRRAADDVVLAEFSSDNGRIQLTSSGLLVLRVSPGLSATWTWERAVYDIVLTNPSSKRFVVASGGIAVQKVITR